MHGDWWRTGDPILIRSRIEFASHVIAHTLAHLPPAERARVVAAMRQVFGQVTPPIARDDVLDAHDALTVRDWRISDVLGR